jgi:transcriptional regulator with XRE-family HTH domain
MSISADGEKDERVEVGRRIRAAREAAGLTLKQAAEAIGSKREATVADYEAGKKTPDAWRIARLAEAFGVSADGLLGRVSEVTTAAFDLAARLDAIERADLSESVKIMKMDALTSLVRWEAMREAEQAARVRAEALRSAEAAAEQRARAARRAEATAAARARAVALPSGGSHVSQGDYRGQVMAEQEANDQS